MAILSGAKGRSSSDALRAQLSFSLPYQLGGNLYLGRHYTPSKLMPSDAPSRGTAMLGPAGLLPQWCRPGVDQVRLDRWLQVPPASKPVADWGRFVLLLEESDASE